MTYADLYNHPTHREGGNGALPYMLPTYTPHESDKHSWAHASKHA